MIAETYIYIPCWWYPNLVYLSLEDIVDGASLRKMLTIFIG
jgi:hypothetical protein